MATYVLAPLPNAVFGRYAGRDDVMSDYQGGIADAGYFLTGLMIITGFCLPVVLAHAGVVSPFGFLRIEHIGYCMTILQFCYCALSNLYAIYSFHIVDHRPRHDHEYLRRSFDLRHEYVQTLFFFVFVDYNYGAFGCDAN